MYFGNSRRKKNSLRKQKDNCFREYTPISEYRDLFATLSDRSRETLSGVLHYLAADVDNVDTSIAYKTKLQKDDEFRSARFTASFTTAGLMEIRLFTATISSRISSLKSFQRSFKTNAISS